MQKIMRLMLLFVVCCFVSEAYCSELKKSDKLIRETVDQVLTVIRNKELKEASKIEKLMDIVSPVFDFQLMARLSLGRSHWPKFSAKQREKFTDLFIEQLRESYIGNVEMVADEKVEFNKPFYSGDKVHVLTRVVTKDEPIEILYKLYADKKSGNLRIYDVEIQGISIIKSYGMQYDQILQTGTPETLLGKMKELIKENK